MLESESGKASEPERGYRESLLFSWSMAPRIKRASLHICKINKTASNVVQSLIWIFAGLLTIDYSVVESRKRVARLGALEKCQVSITLSHPCWHYINLEELSLPPPPSPLHAPTLDTRAFAYLHIVTLMHVRQ